MRATRAGNQIQSALVRTMCLLLLASCAVGTSPLQAQNPRSEEAPPAFVPGEKQKKPAKSVNDRTLPDPYRLNANDQARLNQVLGYWENRSGKVKTFECEFTRMNYDSVFGPKNPNFAKSQSKGIIRYAAPDKGEFKVTEVGDFQQTAGKGAPSYPMNESDHDEHWICDGESVFELNGKTKQLREEKLPPEMQGKGISQGPLPFIFGAKKDDLLKRYWMRELPLPNDRTDEYWIEAQPKFREDVANFQRITVILDKKLFLPKAMQVYPPAYDGRKNWTRTVYVFEKRKVNDPLQGAQKFLGRFISPQVPRGWKKVVNTAPVSLPLTNAPNEQRPHTGSTPKIAPPR